MTSTRKPLPATTLSKLIPPSHDHRYFEGFRDHSFEPSDTGESLAKAWWLAETALLAYGHEEFVGKRLEDVGLTEAFGLEVRWVRGKTRGACGLVVEGDRFVIVAFRGSRIESFPDPILNLKFHHMNWVDLATDLDIRVPPGEHVHRGFKEALDEVWDDLSSDLGGTTRRPVGRKPCWFTGHSLGGALATLAADRFGADRVAGLYTFGSPRVGDRQFRTDFKVPAYRFVNNTDIVPHLPPTGLTAGFEHVGALRFIDRSGRIVTDPTSFEMAESQVRAHLDAAAMAFETLHPERMKEAGRAILEALRTREFTGFGNRLEALNLDFLPVPALADHMPINYAILVWNALVHERTTGR